MKTQLQTYWRRFLKTSGYCTPPGRAACALASARTLLEWEQAEASERVRISAEPEQESYADVYGRDLYEQSKEYIEKWGCYWVRTEYLAPDGKWRFADSIGMCVYKDPTDPFDNDYVPGLMRAALDQMNEAWEMAAQAV